MRYYKQHKNAKEKAQRSQKALRQSFILHTREAIDPMRRTQAVCFTGHRHIAADELPALTALLDDVLAALYRRGYRYFISGGALGFDTLAAERVSLLQETHPDIRLILALPCSNQTHGWSERDCRRYERMLYAADETHVLSPDYYEGCMHVRNRFMVNNAALCLCYMKYMKGGTVSTVAYALRENVPVLNLAMADTCAAFIQASDPISLPHGCSQDGFPRS